MEQLLSEEAVRRSLDSGKLLRDRNSTRMKLLAGAVMVEPDVLPQLASAVARIHRQFPSVGALECFVYNGSDINAFITPGRTKTLAAMSSAAVNALAADELEFVLGHELGHALLGHTRMATAQLVEQGDLMPTSVMRVHAWQRAAEISADRAGLVLCGSIDAAARAVFKAASGIVSPDVVVSPARFAGQWHRLLDEVVDAGDRDYWQVSHPFPALRMQALLLFWNAWRQGDAKALDDANAAVSRMLALMDPLAASRTLEDPMLAAFFYWGGLYVALADHVLHDSEEARLRSVAPLDLDCSAAIASAIANHSMCLDAFAAARRSRRTKLTALELHRIIYGLIDVASADGHVSEDELSRLRELAALLDVPAHACDLIVRQYEQEVRGAA